jgi:hypothetical protein
VPSSSTQRRRRRRQISPFCACPRRDDRQPVATQNGGYARGILAHRLLSTGARLRPGAGSGLNGYTPFGPDLEIAHVGDRHVEFLGSCPSQSQSGNSRSLTASKRWSHGSTRSDCATGSSTDHQSSSKTGPQTVRLTSAIRICCPVVIHLARQSATTGAGDGERGVHSRGAEPRRADTSAQGFGAGQNLITRAILEQ